MAALENEQTSPNEVTSMSGQASSVDTTSAAVGGGEALSTEATSGDAQPSENEVEIQEIQYVPVKYHWFYEKKADDRLIWYPFSISDSAKIEEAFLQPVNGEDTIVSTNGGRYDVYIEKRIRKPIFWLEKPSSVRRCSWFYREEGESIFSPYSEDFSDILEAKYKDCVYNSRWNVRIDIAAENQFLQFNSPSMLRHFQVELGRCSDWSDTPENPIKPRVVHRGIDSFDIDAGEPRVVDHLVFIVHGVGSVCDWKFRVLTEVVDGFRSMSLSLMRHHFKDAYNTSTIGRVEFLPVSWHTALHGDATGIDDRLKLITLQSIPKLREFSNDTILDALFYTSPVYCQTIIDAVASEMNRLYKLFLERNPLFAGSVAVVGHSLGSLILFDLLAHQDAGKMEERNLKQASTDPDDLENLLKQLDLQEHREIFTKHKLNLDAVLRMSSQQIMDLKLPKDVVQKIFMYARRRDAENCDMHSESSTVVGSALPRKQSVTSVNYSFGSPGTGCPFIKYSPLDFSPDHFFALGSPIAMFLTVRGMETLKEDFRLPTCPHLYNIFHPFDPIAYRIEPLIRPEFADIKPVLIPHHKGRKRMHLQLKENIVKVGSDLKEKVFGSLKQTWNSINEFARGHVAITQAKSADSINCEEEQEPDLELEAEKSNQSTKHTPRSSLTIGQLNCGLRIDYVLQETPFEFLNEYVFALSSHVCYWESEDTALLILKKLYSSNSIHALFSESRNRTFSLQNVSK